MKNPFKKKPKKQPVPKYQKCGKTRTQRMPNGSVVTEYCTGNKNQLHRHFS